MSAQSAALILASGSRYRSQLLDRLQLDHAVDPADIDESPQPGEPHPALALRLARAKAQAVAARHADAWVLGSDQVASLGQQQLGKPGTRERAAEQLRACSGKTVVFYTSACLLRGEQCWEYLDTTRVRFRSLTDADIHAYLDAEDALDCAGSFKSEGLGVSLISSMQTEDPTALIGLPLIALSARLRALDLLG